MRPKDLLLKPKQFGKQLDVVWINNQNPTDIAAAVFQHRCCYEMRRAIRQRYGTVKAYCEETNQSYQRLGQILRGESVINGSDIGNAGIYLNIEMDVSLSVPNKLAGSLNDRDTIGAFYTPDSISELMVSKILRDASSVLEPSFGDGSFLRALKSYSDNGSEIIGCEIDAAACQHAVTEEFLTDSQIFFGSFFDLPVSKKFSTALGNPPYVRLRSLDESEKQQMQSICKSIANIQIGEESSEWLPFLIKAQEHLEDHGCLAFVLPYDFTYVKYARSTWEFLGKRFGRIEVLRSKERIFGDILQDVILFFAYDKGAHTDIVEYKCYETNQDLLNDTPSISSLISIKEIAKGSRVFQKALIPSDVLELLSGSDFFVRAGEEADFRIGYVCGNKSFFHPDSDTIKKFSLPNSSLRNSVCTSRQLGNSGLRISQLTPTDRLWLPGASLSKGEKRYVSFGERQKVNEGYKCRIRNPWWLVPSVKTPDAVISVFGSAPRLILNDASWTFSNSLLGAYIHAGIDPLSFCLSWYTPLTLLSIELEIHSLGGGVLVAVPREASNVIKVATKHYSTESEKTIDRLLANSDTQGAYYAGKTSLTSLIGVEMTDKIISSYEYLKSWRIKS